MISPGRRPNQLKTSPRPARAPSRNSTPTPASSRPMTIKLFPRPSHTVLLIRASCNQQLRDLYRIDCSAFSEIVRHHPEIESVWNGLVLADPTDVHLVFSGDIKGHRVDP